MIVGWSACSLSGPRRSNWPGLRDRTRHRNRLAEALWRCRLDRNTQGFLRLRDWGSHDHALVRIVETLTTRYMRKHLRLPSAVSSSEAVEAYLSAKKAKEVSSMKQMRELAAAYAFQRSSQSKNTGVGPVEAALRFVDMDGSGRLGKCAPLESADVETLFNCDRLSCCKQS